MRVNEAKTQLICLSTNSSYDVHSTISACSSMIKSAYTLKILGFVINRRAGIGAYTEHIAKNIGMRFWTLTHMKRMGVSQENMMTVYGSLTRPIIEYVAAVRKAGISTIPCF